MSVNCIRQPSTINGYRVCLYILLFLLLLLLLLGNTELGQLSTRSDLTRLEVSSLVSPGFFCLLVYRFLVFSVIYYGAFRLYVATNFLCIPTR
jgi:hypothetical protein